MAATSNSGAGGSGGCACWAAHQRGIAACYLIVYVSLGAQISGLIGPQGVWPATETMDVLRTGGAPMHRFPTLFWFVDPTDSALQALCAVGAVASILAIVGAGTRLPLLVAYTIFLSMQNVGHEFLCHPWDIMLPEAGALALLLPPVKFMAWRAPEPAAAVRFANRFLGFKLTLGMGLHKFYMTDEKMGGMWWLGTYLDTYYVWQPSPTPLVWYASNAPKWFHVGGCVIVGISQVIMPFFMFGPRPLRYLFALSSVGEQTFIQLTGNYGYFNVITAVLCVFPMLDDWALLPPLPPVSPPSKLPLARLRAGLPNLDSVFSMTNVACGAFILVRRLLFGLVTSEYHPISAMHWLFTDAEAYEWMAYIPPAFGLDGLYEVLKPLILVHMRLLRLMSPYRACSDYGIFRVTLHNVTESGKQRRNVVEFGQTDANGVWQPIVLRTSFWSANGGPQAQPHPTRAYPPWVAPLDWKIDRLWYAVAIAGWQGHNIVYDHHHMWAHAHQLHNKVTHMLLQCGGGSSSSPVAQLFAHVPPNLTKVEFKLKDCVLTDDPPHASPTGLMWDCEMHQDHALYQDNLLAPIERPQAVPAGCVLPDDPNLPCPVECFKMFAEHWDPLHEQRITFLKDNLEKEISKCEQPTSLHMISFFVAMLVASCLYPRLLRKKSGGEHKKRD